MTPIASVPFQGSCSVCCKKLDLNQTITRLACKHLFCLTCFLTWKDFCDFEKRPWRCLLCPTPIVNHTDARNNPVERTPPRRLFEHEINAHLSYWERKIASIEQGDTKQVLTELTEDIILTHSKKIVLLTKKITTTIHSHPALSSLYLFALLSDDSQLHAAVLTLFSACLKKGVNYREILQAINNPVHGINIRFAHLLTSDERDRSWHHRTNVLLHQFPKMKDRLFTQNLELALIFFNDLLNAGCPNHIILDFIRKDSGKLSKHYLGSQHRVQSAFMKLLHRLGIDLSP